MRNKLYGSFKTAKLNATINPLNKAKLELLARQNGVSVSTMLNLLIDMSDPPVGWAEFEKHLIRQNTKLIQLEASTKGSAAHG